MTGGSWQSLKRISSLKNPETSPPIEFVDSFLKSGWNSQRNIDRFANAALIRAVRIPMSHSWFEEGRNMSFALLFAMRQCFVRHRLGNAMH